MLNFAHIWLPMLKVMLAESATASHSMVVRTDTVVVFLPHDIPQ